jgi:hypothetical protein
MTQSPKPEGVPRNCTALGHAMTQVVSRRPFPAKARVSPCGIFGGQSGIRRGFSPCQFHSTAAPLHKKTRKNLIIFITGLHNKPQKDTVRP